MNFGVPGSRLDMDGFQIGRPSYAGIGQNRFASFYASLEATLDEGDISLQEYLAREFQVHSDPKDFNMGFDEGDNVLHFAASAGFLSVINLWHQPRPVDIMLEF